MSRRVTRLQTISMTLAILLACALAPAASRAAVSFTVLASLSDASPISTATWGSVLTLDINFSSDAPVAGLQASAYGYDTSVLSFVSGTAVDWVFAEVCPSPTLCLGGAANQVAGDLEEVDGRVQFVNFLNVLPSAPANGPGTIDYGVDGTIGGPHARMIFQLSDRPGSTTITIGPSIVHLERLIDTNGGPGTVNRTAVTVTKLPEPTTAVLLGLGLGALALGRSGSTLAQLELH